jgi:ATP/maltotriose-dependent transcriptional regulator MalT
VEDLTTPLVGRDAELQALERALDAVAGGSAPVVEVVGEPGIGKTRLLGELCASAEERGHLVLSGRAAEFERDLPFGVFVDALDDYLGSLQPRTFEHLGEDEVRELASIFPSVPLAAEASGGLLGERYRAHHSVRVLLERLAAKRPIVLVLDDLHWADDAAVGLISHLLRRRPSGPVLVLLALRSGQAPARLGAALEEAAREGVVERLELAALTRRQAEALLGSAVDPGMVDALYEASGGNPFYLEQLMRSAGPEALRAGHVEAGIASADVPPAVAAALARELERLSPLARTVVEAAAVVGEPFEPDLVADTAGVTEGEVLAVVDELLDSRLIARTEAPRRFRFRHPIVRHAVYESAKVGWRTESHRRAIDALAARGARPAVIAPHVERSACAGDETAISTLTAAGQAAAARAPASAARWFEAALRLLPEEAETDARIGLLLPLAIALAATGRFEESRAAVEEALRLLPPELSSMRVQLVAARAGIEHLLGRYDAARARLEAALVDSASVGWGEEAALKLELAGNRLFASDFEAALRWAGEALQAARTHNDDAIAAAATAQLSFAECSLGRMDRADAFRGDAVALLQRLDDAGGSVRLDALVMLGWSEYFLERFEDARDRFQRAAATSRATGQMYMLVPSMLGLAYAHATLGGLGDADELAAQAVEAARLGADTRGLSWALFERCWIAVLAGDLETAIRCGEESVKIARTLDESFLSAGAGVPLAAAVLESGDPDRCVELILTLIGGEELPWVMRGVRCLCYELLTRAELARGSLDEAARWAERAEFATEGLRPGMATGRVRRTRAHVLLASGSAAAAAREALAAAADADRVGARLEAARSRTLAGRALAAAGEAGRAAGELEAAEAALAVLEARRYRDEAARELRLLGRAVPRHERGKRRADEGEGVPSLSARELEVAKLVAEGKTNRQIAAEIFLSEKTVESHLSHIFSKLGVRSRSAVAAEVTRGHAELRA